MSCGCHTTSSLECFRRRARPEPRFAYFLRATSHGWASASAHGTLSPPSSSASTTAVASSATLAVNASLVSFAMRLSSAWGSQGHACHVVDPERGSFVHILVHRWHVWQFTLPRQEHQLSSCTRGQALMSRHVTILFHAFVVIQQGDDGARPFQVGEKFVDLAGLTDVSPAAEDNREVLILLHHRIECFSPSRQIWDTQRWPAQIRVF